MGRKANKVGAAQLLGTAAGMALVLIPEPATTLTGAAIVTAIWAPKLLGRK